MKKALYSVGSVRVKPNGTHECRIYIGEDTEGKSLYKSLSAKNEKVLKQRIKDFVNNQQKYTEKVCNTIFKDYALHWMQKYKYPALKPVSYDRLEQTYNKTCEYIGMIQMASVTSDDVQSMINDLAKNKAYSTVKKHFEFVKNVFHHAVVSRKLQFNPCDAVVLPAERNMKVQTKLAEVLTDKETNAMYSFNESLKESKNQFFKHMPAILLMLNTGWRIGELLALEWKDVDFGKRQATISKTLAKAKSRDENGNVLDKHKETFPEKTKTKSGERITPLNDTAIELLHQIKDYNKRMGIKSKYVVCTSKGGYVSERNMLRTFNCVMGVVGAEKNYTIHSLRHTFATRLLMNGTHVSIVSKLLGHADINTTYSKYIHVIEGQTTDEMLKYARI